MAAALRQMPQRIIRQSDGEHATRTLLQGKGDGQRLNLVSETGGELKLTKEYQADHHNVIRSGSDLGPIARCSLRRDRSTVFGFMMIPEAEQN